MRTTEVAALAGDGDELFRAQRWADANLDPRRVIPNAQGRGWSREWSGREALAYIAYRKTLRLLGGPDSKQLATRVADFVQHPSAPIDQTWYFADADAAPIFCSDLIFEKGGVVLPISVWACLEAKAVAA